MPWSQPSVAVKFEPLRLMVRAMERTPVEDVRGSRSVIIVVGEGTSYWLLTYFLNSVPDVSPSHLIPLLSRYPGFAVAVDLLCYQRRLLSCRVPLKPLPACPLTIVMAGAGRGFRM